MFARAVRVEELPHDLAAGGHLESSPEIRFGDQRVPVGQSLGRAAPLGIEFYTGKQFPKEYRNQIFVAEHGSWNRSKKIGYRIMLLRLEGNEVVSYEPFAEGWLDEEKDKAWGRPVDIELLPDGSMLVSDDYADVIYRIYYEG